jgi:protocatechuate 3,4-dioxygenase beta subunit
MVPSARHVVACLLLIFGHALHSRSQTVPATKVANASISGKVTIKGKGTPGIVVGLRLVESHDQRSTRLKAVTDDQGNYRITNVPPGQYQVIAMAPAFVQPDELATARTILISKDETIENINIGLVRGGVITGKITDAEGRPVIEEEVFVYPAQMNSRFYRVPTIVRTDDRGVYRFFGLQAGNYRVAAGQREESHFGGRVERIWHKMTYHPAATEISQASIVEVTEGGEVRDVDITLGREAVKYNARGRVVDGKTGQPVPNARYGLQYFMSEQTVGSMTAGAVSDSNGEFKFENLSPGKYAVFLEASPDSDVRADPVPFEVIDQDISGLIVKTFKGASVTGVVVLEGTDDKALQAELRKMHVQANVLGEDSPGNDGQLSRLDQDGSFRLGALKAGTVMFSVSSSGSSRLHLVRLERGGVAYPKGIPIQDGEQMSGVRLVLNYGNGAVRGVATLESGTLAQDALLLIQLKMVGGADSLFSPFHRSARVDARGQFFVDGLLPGTYDVIANIYTRGSRGSVGRVIQQVTVANDSVTNITVNVNVKQTP